MVLVKQDKQTAAATADEVLQKLLTEIQSGSKNATKPEDILTMVNTVSHKIREEEHNKLEKFVSAMPKITLPCGHVFHLSRLCSNGDLTQCPLCKHLHEKVIGLLKNEG